MAEVCLKAVRKFRLVLTLEVLCATFQTLYRRSYPLVFCLWVFVVHERRFMIFMTIDKEVSLVRRNVQFDICCFVVAKVFGATSPDVRCW
jgi:hypothetical protein